jgi:predicted DNA binding CopG/RHH family protein
LYLEHSVAEEHLKAIGRTSRGRYVFVAFTIRERNGERLIRPISARYLHAKEVAHMKKRIPIFESDEEAERFVETADLTEYDLSQFKPARFEFEKKAARVNMRLPEPLLAAVKARAKARGIPYQRFIREALEQALAKL